MHRKSVREDGVFSIGIDNSCSLFRYVVTMVLYENVPRACQVYLRASACVCVCRGLQKEEMVLLTHGDSVDKVADGFKVVAQSGNIIAGTSEIALPSVRGDVLSQPSL